MTTIASIQTDHYLIKLPVTLSDSTHGQMNHFELVTVRIRDKDGAEGSGYTFTVGTNGAAVYTTVKRDLAPRLEGERADLIEALWKKMWWALHYGGRGGTAAMAISAVDIALWDLKARKFGVPLWTLLGGDDPKVPCYAGGIDLYFPLDKLLAQTDDNLKKGFRAIKMKVGRPKLSEDVARVQAMREHLGADFPLMVDANMRWTPDEAIRAARAFLPSQVAWLEEPTIPDDVLGHARIVREGGLPVATGENLHTLYEFAQMIHAGGVTFPEPDVTNCGGVTRVHEGGATGRGLQPAGHLAWRARHHRAPACGRAQPLLSRSARLRTGSLHRPAAADPGGVRRCAGPPRAWDRVRLEGVGGLPGLALRFRRRKDATTEAHGGEPTLVTISRSRRTPRRATIRPMSRTFRLPGGPLPVAVQSLPFKGRARVGMDVRNPHPLPTP